MLFQNPCLFCRTDGRGLHGRGLQGRHQLSLCSPWRPGLCTQSLGPREAMCCHRGRRGASPAAWGPCHLRGLCGLALGPAPAASPLLGLAGEKKGTEQSMPSDLDPRILKAFLGYIRSTVEAAAGAGEDGVDAANLIPLQKKSVLNIFNIDSQQPSSSGTGLLSHMDLSLNPHLATS